VQSSRREKSKTQKKSRDDLRKLLANQIAAKKSTESQTTPVQHDQHNTHEEMTMAKKVKKAAAKKPAKKVAKKSVRKAATRKTTKKAAKKPAKTTAKKTVRKAAKRKTAKKVAPPVAM